MILRMLILWVSLRHAWGYWVWAPSPHHEWRPIVRHTKGRVAAWWHGRMREIRRWCTRWERVVWRWVHRLGVGGANRSRYYCAGRYRGRGSGLL